MTSKLLLAIDTCGPTGSIALGQLVGGELHILGETSLGGHRPSETLVGYACGMLRMAGLQFVRLGAIVAVNGPGGFTGVRVGLATVKGLAESAKTPVVAVSRLEVLASKAGVASAALNAHRHEVFLRVGGGDGQARELLAGAAELAALDSPPKRIAVCDEAAAELLHAAWPEAELVRVSAPMAEDALRLCAARATAGEFVDLALLDGNYLRRSDAEIFGEAAEAAAAAEEAAVAAEEAAAARRKRVPPDAVIQARPMREEDLDEVVMIAASQRQAPFWPRETYKAALNPDATPRRIALVVEVNGKLAGLAVASLMPPQAELETIVIDTYYQRYGLARRLFQELAGRLRL
ncbi:MAG TPA: tRNA (adenosine(37)-N6)-threonylcarbamoyltransferase complex dimerization subunit type 1 TsaB, partial [Terracidiphilus sp.]|nr:tRNA (adenosine(37)-N6)-threonylcarbamoyltransferase complex dimerization subunit type 1 TsaB [Terracidiphilus sp.]